MSIICQRYIPSYATCQPPPPRPPGKKRKWFWHSKKAIYLYCAQHEIESSSQFCNPLMTLKITIFKLRSTTGQTPSLVFSVGWDLSCQELRPNHHRQESEILHCTRHTSGNISATSVNTLHSFVRALPLQRPVFKWKVSKLHFRNGKSWTVSKNTKIFCAKETT
jgi:hypothetical protein